MNAPGHDGQSRGSGLINSPATSGHFFTQAADPPVDCFAITSLISADAGGSARSDGGCSDAAIGLLFDQDRPRDARELIGQGNDSDIVMDTCPERGQPGAEGMARWIGAEQD